LAATAEQKNGNEKKEHSPFCVRRGRNPCEGRELMIENGPEAGECRRGLNRKKASMWSANAEKKGEYTHHILLY